MRQEQKVSEILLGLGATVLPKENHLQADISPSFVLLPHDIAKETAVSDELLRGSQAVSELWLEKCMLTKTLVPVSNYALGRVIMQPVLPLQGLTINATGFDAIENRHMSKVVPLLGGKYTETFSSTVSVLLYRTATGNRTKLEVAWRSNIPVVTEHWLWSTIKKQVKADITRFIVQNPRARLGDKRDQVEQKVACKDDVQLQRQQTVEQDVLEAVQHHLETRAADVEAGLVEGKLRRTSQPVLAIHEEVAPVEEKTEVKQAGAISPTGGLMQKESQLQEREPLQEIPPVSARRNGRDTSHAKMQPHTFDGQSSAKCNEPKAAEKSQKAGQNPADIAAINGALRDILGEQARKRAPVNAAPSKKKGLIGRALSNLSNTSRHSRASSIDSMNTDGIGSELTGVPVADKACGETATTAEKSAFSFTGRAKSTLAGLQSASYGMDDPDLARSGDFRHEQEVTPQMTQLGYEDPEEAVLLREKLAASRKTRSSKVAEDTQPRDDAATRPKAAERKIRDDDLQADANARWGAGRRTRHKQRSTPDRGLKQF
jgi:hypothetical protein